MTHEFSFYPRQQQMDSLLAAGASLAIDKLSNHASDTDRKHELAQYGKADSLGDFADSVGKDATGGAHTYFSKLLSGDPTAIGEATAPQQNALTAQTDAEKRRIASEGTSRGGGINDTLQQLSDRPITTQVDAITRLMPAAAGQEAQIGGQQEGLASSIQQHLMSQAAQDRQFDTEQENQQFGGLAQLLANPF